MRKITYMKPIATKLSVSSREYPLKLNKDIQAKSSLKFYKVPKYKDKDV